MSAPEQSLRALGERAPVRVLGTVGGEALQIAIVPAPRQAASDQLTVSLAELSEAHSALAELFA